MGIIEQIDIKVNTTADLVNAANEIENLFQFCYSIGLSRDLPYEKRYTIIVDAKPVEITAKHCLIYPYVGFEGSYVIYKGQSMTVDRMFCHTFDLYDTLQTYFDTAQE
jgi:hypothetical protein